MGTYRATAAVASIAFTLVACHTQASRSDAGGNGCYQALPLTSVRLFPAPGHAAELVGGTIQGSNDSATNGFETLATITAAPAEGEWLDVPIATTNVYRWVKYYGPPNVLGRVAEVEFYVGSTRLDGTSFGTTGTSGHTYQAALDGNTATYYEGTETVSNYVGIDPAAGHMVGEPTFSPRGGPYTSGRDVTIASSTSGATIRYSVDGSDPTNGAVYSSPVHVGPGSTTIRAVATKTCMASSGVVSSTYEIGSNVVGMQSFLAVGNSLTDTIDGYISPVATSGGVDLSWNRYTVPGIGTWVYDMQPTGGFGVANVQTAVKTVIYDHLSFQPFPNMPCVPSGHANESTAQNRSDAVNIDQAWDDAVGVNPSVQMWIYEAWPPTPTEGYSNCVTGGGWLRDPAIWNPSSPGSWNAAEANELLYMEAVRSALIALEPSRPVPYIVPAGRVVRNVKTAVEAGQVPGVASNAFFTTFFSNNGTDDHLTPIGRYIVALTFYACLFQADPRDLADTALGTSATVTSAQAALFQQIVYDTVTGYALSGYAR